MKRVPLRNKNGPVKAYALVDDADYEALSKHRWNLAPNGYAYRPSPKAGSIYMHRQIMGLKPGDTRQVDHANHNRADNRRENLRVVTRSQNHQNRTPTMRRGRSRFRGVGYDKRLPLHPWVARCRLGGRVHIIGYFCTEEAAGRAAEEFRIKHMPLAPRDPELA